MSEPKITEEQYKNALKQVDEHQDGELDLSEEAIDCLAVLIEIYEFQESKPDSEPFHPHITNVTEEMEMEAWFKLMHFRQNITINELKELDYYKQTLLIGMFEDAANK